MTQPKNIRDIAGINFNLDELVKIAAKGKEDFFAFSENHFWHQSVNKARQTQRIEELWAIVEDYSKPEPAEKPNKADKPNK